MADDRATFERCPLQHAVVSYIKAYSSANSDTRAPHNNRFENTTKLSCSKVAPYRTLHVSIRDDNEKETHTRRLRHKVVGLLMLMKKIDSSLILSSDLDSCCSLIHCALESLLTSLCGPGGASAQSFCHGGRRQS